MSCQLQKGQKVKLLTHINKQMMRSIAEKVARKEGVDLTLMTDAIKLATKSFIEQHMNNNGDINLIEDVFRDVINSVINVAELLSVNANQAYKQLGQSLKDEIIDVMNDTANSAMSPGERLVEHLNKQLETSIRLENFNNLFTSGQLIATHSLSTNELEDVENQSVSAPIAQYFSSVVQYDAMSIKPKEYKFEQRNFGNSEYIIKNHFKNNGPVGMNTINQLRGEMFKLMFLDLNASNPADAIAKNFNNDGLNMVDNKIKTLRQRLIKEFLSDFNSSQLKADADASNATLSTIEDYEKFIDDNYSTKEINTDFFRDVPPKKFELYQKIKLISHFDEVLTMFPEIITVNQAFANNYSDETNKVVKYGYVINENSRKGFSEGMTDAMTEVDKTLKFVIANNKMFGLNGQESHNAYMDYRAIIPLIAHLDKSDKSIEGVRKALLDKIKNPAVDTRVRTHYMSLFINFFKTDASLLELHRSLNFAPEIYNKLKSRNSYVEVFAQADNSAHYVPTSQRDLMSIIYKMMTGNYTIAYTKISEDDNGGLSEFDIRSNQSGQAEYKFASTLYRSLQGQKEQMSDDSFDKLYNFEVGKGGKGTLKYGNKVVATTENGAVTFKDKDKFLDMLQGAINYDLRSDSFMGQIRMKELLSAVEGEGLDEKRNAIYTRAFNLLTGLLKMNPDDYGNLNREEYGKGLKNDVQFFSSIEDVLSGNAVKTTLKNPEGKSIPMIGLQNDLNDHPAIMKNHREMIRTNSSPYGMPLQHNIFVQDETGDVFKGFTYRTAIEKGGEVKKNDDMSEVELAMANINYQFFGKLISAVSEKNSDGLINMEFGVMADKGTNPFAQINIKSTNSDRPTGNDIFMLLNSDGKINLHKDGTKMLTKSFTIKGKQQLSHHGRVKHYYDTIVDNSIKKYNASFNILSQDFDAGNIKPVSNTQDMKSFNARITAMNSLPTQHQRMEALQTILNDYINVGFYVKGHNRPLSGRRLLGHLAAKAGMEFILDMDFASKKSLVSDENNNHYWTGKEQKNADNAYINMSLYDEVKRNSDVNKYQEHMENLLIDFAKMLQKEGFVIPEDIQNKMGAALSKDDAKYMENFGSALLKTDNSGNTTVNPIIAMFFNAWNITQENMLAAHVGTPLAHPGKSDMAKWVAQTKRNVMFTATMHNYMSSLGVIRDNMNFALMEDTRLMHDILTPIGIKVPKGEVHDGASISSVASRYMRQVSMGGRLGFQGGKVFKDFGTIRDYQQGTMSVWKQASSSLSNEQLQNIRSSNLSGDQLMEQFYRGNLEGVDLTKVNKEINDEVDLSDFNVYIREKTNQFATGDSMYTFIKLQSYSRNADGTYDFKYVDSAGNVFTKPNITIKTTHDLWMALGGTETYSVVPNSSKLSYTFDGKKLNFKVSDASHEILAEIQMNLMSQNPDGSWEYEYDASKLHLGRGGNARLKNYPGALQNLKRFSKLTHRPNTLSRSLIKQALDANYLTIEEHDLLMKVMNDYDALNGDKPARALYRPALGGDIEVMAFTTGVKTGIVMQNSQETYVNQQSKSKLNEVKFDDETQFGELVANNPNILKQIFDYDFEYSC